MRINIAFRLLICMKSHFNFGLALKWKGRDPVFLYIGYKCVMGLKYSVFSEIILQYKLRLSESSVVDIREVL